MNKSNSGHKWSKIAEKRTTGFEDNGKSGRPIGLKDLGYMTDNNNNTNIKNKAENEKGWNVQAKSQQPNKVRKLENNRQNVAFYKKRSTSKDGD